MVLCDFEKCTGCGACFNSCPKQCISMDVFSNGFKYPNINHDVCIECGICKNSCPVIHPQNKRYPISSFSATYKSNDNALYNSSSGGVAYALSKRFLENGGVVFGAAYDDYMNVIHIEIHDDEGLKKIQGSKYVQSDTGMTYARVKECLSSNIKVLYFGLPCQIGGLYSYLGNINKDNLTTCDLLCGGAPSPGVFKKYIGYLETKYNKRVKDLNFRSKKYGYGYLLLLLLQDEKECVLYGKNADYLKSLGAGYNRSSCFDCEYAALERVGDLTIGDFWHLEIESNIWEKGVSLLLVNTLKGNDLFSSIKDNLLFQERSIEDVMRSQHASIGKKKSKPLDYDNYFKDYQLMEWDAFSKKYLRAKRIKQRIIDGIHPAIMFRITNALRK